MDQVPDSCVQSIACSCSASSGAHCCKENQDEYQSTGPTQPLICPNKPAVFSQAEPNHRRHHLELSGLMEQEVAAWYIEIFSLLCSVICAIFIVVLLGIYDDTPLESWEFFFSINTVVSTLGVVLRSTLLMAVFAALAQGKWTWFRRKGGPLGLFERIDAGSRGSLASFELILHMRGKHLVSLGALVMVLGSLIGPFLQAIISDVGRLIDVDAYVGNDMNAAIGNSNFFDGGTLTVSTYAARYAKVATLPDFAIAAALYDGLNEAITGRYQNVSVTCMSGNCTWGEHTSLAIRSTCFDISSHLKGTHMEQPNGTTTSSWTTDNSATWMDWTLEHLNLTLSNTAAKWRAANYVSVLQAAVVADPNLTLNFNDSQTLLAAFTTIRADDSSVLGSADWDAAPASAMECGLELSLNVYNSSMVNKVLIEHIVASASQRLPKSWLPLPDFNQDSLHPNGLGVDQGTSEWNPVFHPTFLYRDDFALDSAALQQNITAPFKITQKSIQSTVDFLTSLIQQDSNNGTVKAVTQGDQPALYIYGSPFTLLLFNLTDTNATFNAIARSLPTAIRGLGTSPMLGTTQQWIRYYKVRWAFLVLPLSLILAGTTFSILSIVDTYRAQVPSWKANSIATMVHGPDEKLQRVLRAKNHVHCLGMTGETEVKLECFPEGYALTAGQQSAAKISRPTTPVRDEEEHEMGMMRPPTSPQTPGSNEPQSGVGAERGGSRPVSLISPRPAWSSN
ncbi:hypothetical protein D6D08_07027 [Aureobasidium pullulans]|nr:hypothetical protein D6D08_07027 [Aureobasidium pullulans]